VNVDSRRQGRCYELAAKTLRDTEIYAAAALVHGTVNGRVGRIGHAWIAVDGGAVYEPVSDEEWTVELFEAKFEPIEARRYSLIEAAHMMITTGHWGPW
jgi:HD superfamily phosphodiesterase